MEAPDEGEDILEDFSDGLEALTAVPVWFLSTWDVPLENLPVYRHFLWYAVYEKVPVTDNTRRHSTTPLAEPTYLYCRKADQTHFRVKLIMNN